MMVEPILLPLHYKTFLATGQQSYCPLPRSLWYKQEFGLSKTSHGLDGAVLDFLPKHLNLLKLLLDVDVPSEKPGLFCVQL